MDARNTEGTTPLHYLARRTEAEHSKDDEALMTLLVDQFVKLGANVNAANASNETPLHLASSHDTSRVLMPLLIKYSADVNAKNKKGETPLHYASRSGLMDVAGLLIAHGARMEVGEHGSPLQVANPGFPDLVNLLSMASQKSFAVPPANVVISSTKATAGTQVIGAARLPARQRRVRHLKSVSFYNGPRSCQSWTLKIYVAGPEAGHDVCVHQQTEQLLTQSPHWELDGTRLAKHMFAERAVGATFSFHGTGINVDHDDDYDDGDGDGDAEEDEQVLVSFAFEELCFFGVELSEAHVRFPTGALVVELVDGYYCQQSVLEYLLAHAALPTIAPPKTVQGESYTLAEFVSLIQTWQLFRNKKTETSGLQVLLEQTLDERRKGLAASFLFFSPFPLLLLLLILYSSARKCYQR